MSVFTKIRLSRKAAKEHKGKAAAEKIIAVKVPYKHIPTHAAFDALSGAPSSWKADDRSKIKEHHKRRTLMGNMPRTASALSTVSYINSAAGPSAQLSPPLPRNSSYSTYNPTWYDRGGDLSYSSGAASNTRQKPARGQSYRDSGIGPSPLTSNDQSAEASPVVSSGNSTSSNSSEHLEMKSPSNPKRLSTHLQTTQDERPQAERPQAIVYQEKDIFDRLHISTTRKLGEAPVLDSPQDYQTPTMHSTKAQSVAAVTAVEEKPKRQRWSLLGKGNPATIAT